jgi:antirestriction protein ArdC
MRGTRLARAKRGWPVHAAPGVGFERISPTETKRLAQRGHGMRPIVVASAITAKRAMKRDLYAEVSARIVAELEAGAAPWIKPWSATPGANTPCNAASDRPYSGCNVVLLWMAQAAGYRTPRFLTFKQALELGGNVRKGERGTKVFFVKQLQVRDQSADDSASSRLIPMMREYTVFNVDQCDNLPDRISTGKPIRVRNPDTRDQLADAFLHSTSADIREGHGEASYIPSKDFISMPAFAGFKDPDHFYNVAFHELTHWTDTKHASIAI